ncbi:MAG: hypothetical protein ACRCX2_33645 [Paraclostridium sp.]
MLEGNKRYLKEILEAKENTCYKDLIMENKIYWLGKSSVITIGLVEGYKGESVVVYRDDRAKLSIMDYKEFMDKAEPVEEL